MQHFFPQGLRPQLHPSHPSFLVSPLQGLSSGGPAPFTSSCTSCCVQHLVPGYHACTDVCLYPETPSPPRQPQHSFWLPNVMIGVLGWTQKYPLRIPRGIFPQHLPSEAKPKPASVEYQDSPHLLNSPPVKADL